MECSTEAITPININYTLLCGSIEDGLPSAVIGTSCHLAGGQEVRPGPVIKDSQWWLGSVSEYS